jgi:hypothetical protein
MATNGESEANHSDAVLDAVWLCEPRGTRPTQEASAAIAATVASFKAATHPRHERNAVGEGAERGQWCGWARVGGDATTDVRIGLRLVGM